MTTENSPAISERQDLIQLPDMLTEPTTQSIQRLELEARAMETAVRIANGLSKTQMVPEHFQSQKGGEAAIYNLAASIMYGAELGLSAVQSAQNVFVVRGKPAVYSRTMAAQVRRAGYNIQEVEASDQKVVWKGLRDGHWSFTEWSIERAQAAGYTTNKLYQTNPTEMLRAKCIAELCRIAYQDVLLGMAYSVEELQLIEGASLSRVVRRQGARGTDRLREIAEQATDAPETEPDPPPQQTEELPAESGPGLATSTQLTKIRALYKERGTTGAEVLHDVAEFLQRKLESLNDIDGDEAKDIIESLQKPG